MPTVQYNGQCMDVSFVCSYYQSTLEHPALSVACTYAAPVLTVVRDAQILQVSTPACDYSDVQGSFQHGLYWGISLAVTFISLKLIFRAIRLR